MSQSNHTSQPDYAAIIILDSIEESCKIWLDALVFILR
jgi:hypothetical protein